MAANLGGSLAPSGAARNIIMMGYTEDMFGMSISFVQWVMYCAPLLLWLMPVTWIVINWRFKPEITDMSHAMAVVKSEVQKTGGGTWTRPQIISIVIFLVMLFTWVTENNLILQWTGIRFGIGVLAVMGGVAYILAGVVNWRDYQTKVDWGVVWLYAGAIIFGRILVQTGGAYWIAQTMLSFTAPLGLGEGLGLLLSGNIIVGLMTQLMADGPACAAVGPVTLAMAGIVHPGTSMIPFVAMGTSIASSFAYCLVIGTPPNAIVYASGYLEPKDFLRVGHLVVHQHGRIDAHGCYLLALDGISRTARIDAAGQLLRGAARDPVRPERAALLGNYGGHQQRAGGIFRNRAATDVHCAALDERVADAAVDIHNAVPFVLDGFTRPICLRPAVYGRRLRQCGAARLLDTWHGPLGGAFKVWFDRAGPDQNRRYQRLEGLFSPCGDRCFHGHDRTRFNRMNMLNQGVDNG
jgi:hypothetical protein